MLSPDLPVVHPGAAALADVEMLAAGAFGAGRGFAPPLPLPEEIDRVARVHGSVVVVDDEGVPIAEVGLDGAVRAVERLRTGPFAALYRRPDELPAGPRRAVLLDRPLTSAECAALAALDGTVLLLACTGAGKVPPPVLLRSLLAASREVAGSQVVALPMGASADPGADRARRALVLEAFAATPAEVLDPDAWRRVEAALHAGDGAALEGLLDPATLDVLLEWRPPPAQRGLVVFLTGLSGSGKSTLAAGLASALEDAGRRVSLLDGDLVRRALSPDLGFSPAERDQNIRRLGWVATEVAKHRGVAVLAPIAPHARTRREVREMVAAVGDFILVWVATPLAECERRDRKGLYARARAGLLPDFTGVSAAYEEPTDADLVLDTTEMTPGQAVDRVLEHLRAGGWLHHGESALPRG